MISLVIFLCGFDMVGYFIFISNINTKSDIEKFWKSNSDTFIWHPYQITYEYGYLYYHFKRIQIHIILMFSHPYPSLITTITIRIRNVTGLICPGYSLPIPASHDDVFLLAHQIRGRAAHASRVENERKYSHSDLFCFLFLSVRFRICGISFPYLRK